jgi:hypothetical protein
MRTDGIRPAFNFESNYRVTMLTREEWTRGSFTPPAVKGLVWYREGFSTPGGTGAGVYWQSLGRRLSYDISTQHAVVSFRSLVILGYEEIKLPTISQETKL